MKVLSSDLSISTLRVTKPSVSVRISNVTVAMGRLMVDNLSLHNTTFTSQLMSFNTADEMEDVCSTSVRWRTLPSVGGGVLDIAIFAGCLYAA